MLEVAVQKGSIQCCPVVLSIIERGSLLNSLTIIVELSISPLFCFLYFDILLLDTHVSNCYICQMEGHKLL